MSPLPLFAQRFCFSREMDFDPTDLRVCTYLSVFDSFGSWTSCMAGEHHEPRWIVIFGILLQVTSSIRIL